jgi:nucleotide-binding universal stress UspA family protein
VVGVSGSQASIGALRLAAGHARCHNALLVAVHAWLPPGGDLTEGLPAAPHLRLIWKHAAARRLQEAIDSAWGAPPAGVRTELRVARGEAGAVLLDIADSADDLLVVGTGRRGTLTRLWRGRVTRYCQARAQCLVLAVPPPALARKRRDRAGGWSFRHRELTAAQVLHEMEKLGPASR